MLKKVTAIKQIILQSLPGYS